MGANDKAAATFHGMTDREIRDARQSELDAISESNFLEEEIAAESRLSDTEIEADKNAAESRGKIWPLGDNENWPIEPGNVVPISEDDVEPLDRTQRFSGRTLSAGLQILINQSGKNSRDHGFHEDFPDLHKTPVSEINLAVTQKLMLITEEITEAFGEIRSGRGTKEIYFVDNKGYANSPEPDFEYSRQHYGLPGSDRHPEIEPCREGDVPLLKPEGFMVELADAMIRIADLVYLLDAEEEFIEALHGKHEYNVTRPYKHGRQF